VQINFKGLKSTERSGLEKTTELDPLKRAREPAAVDDFYSKRMRICKLDDANIDDHTRKVQASNWALIINQQKQKVGHLYCDV
jgi:hypothetical protein